MKKVDQGVNIERYQVIPRTLIFILKMDEILLLKGAPDKKIWANHYNGVGGHIEPGENIYDAAKRELLEETGLSEINLTFRASIMIDVNSNIGISLFVFVGEYQSGMLRSNGEGSLDWIKISEIKKYPLVEDLYVLIPKLMDSRGFLYGHYHFINDKLITDFQG